MNSEQPLAVPKIQIRMENVGGAWENFARVGQRPHEFTIDFIRMKYDGEPTCVVASRVIRSPLFVRQLTDALEENWSSYARQAVPIEARGPNELIIAS